MPDPDGTRRTIGLIVYCLFMMVGFLFNVLVWLGTGLGAKRSGAFLDLLLVTVVAVVPLAVYLAVPYLVDRYDPEPWYCLLMALGWGAFVATSAAGIMNDLFAHVVGSALGPAAGRVLTVVISAPFSEELWKGLLVLGFFVFLRREFDGVVDGVIYAAFCALGFAAVENIQYYFQASQKGSLGGLFWVRGVVAPWGHPLYTSMTGVGLGIARETKNPAFKILAPLGGLAAAMLLHAAWNFFCVLGEAALYSSLVFWFGFLACFAGVLLVLVRRKRDIIRTYLRDEVALGTLTAEEVELVTSAFGRGKAKRSWRGEKGEALVRAAARLALKKWHTVRALEGKTRTISAEFIGPLRAEIIALRAELEPLRPRR